MIKLIIILSLILIVFVKEKFTTTMILTGVWFLYSIYYFIKLYINTEKKIKTNKFSTTPPNNNYSAYIRYLHKGKVDYKVFVTTIVELILKGSISFGRRNKNEYYLIDNNVKYETLSKNEEFVKKIIFKHIGNSDKVSFDLIKRKCASNSGYIYSLYKDWQNVFEYECAYNSYFKSNKETIDHSLSYLVSGIIVSICNMIFTKYIFLAIFILSVVGLLCKYINDLRNFEGRAKIEYEKWLEFKNYIDKYDNSLDELDNTSLENYATYAYVLDSYDSFVRVLNKKSSKNSDVFNESVILTIMNLRIFDYVDKLFKDCINEIFFNSRILFSKNRGRG